MKGRGRKERRCNNKRRTRKVECHQSPWWRRGSPSEKQQEAAIKKRLEECLLDLAVRLSGNHRLLFAQPGEVRDPVTWIWGRWDRRQQGEANVLKC